MHKESFELKECPRIKTRFMTNILSLRLNIVITCLYINMHMVEVYGTSLQEKLTNEEQYEQWAVYSTTEEQRMLRFWKVTFYAVYYQPIYAALNLIAFIYIFHTKKCELSEL